MHLLFYWEFSTSVDPLLIGFGGPPHTHTGQAPAGRSCLPLHPSEPGSSISGQECRRYTDHVPNRRACHPVLACPFLADWKIKFASTPCTQVRLHARRWPLGHDLDLTVLCQQPAGPPASLKSTYVQNTRAGEIRSINKKQPREQSAVIGGEPVSPVSRYICADTSRSKPGQGKIMPLPPKRRTMHRCTCTPAQAMSADAANPSRRALSGHARCGPPACSRR